MARIVALSANLMLASRVRAPLDAAGHEVEQMTELPSELGNVDLVVADLDAVAPEELANLPVPALGFYSHTDIAMKKRGEGAGLALVVPRSRMSRELPELVERLLAQV